MGIPEKKDKSKAKQYTLRPLRHNTPLLGALAFAVLFLLVLTFPSPACANADENEIELGRKYAQILENKYGLVKDDALLQRINTIGQQLTSVSDRPGLPYTFKILKSKKVNAASLAGGFIYLYNGLVRKMPTDAELSGVLAHEISHVVYRHSLQNKASLHKQELEADAMAVELALRAGHNPYGIFVVVSKIDDKRRKKDSHPGVSDRLRLLDSIARQKGIHPFVVPGPDGNALLTDNDSWQMAVPPADGYTAMQRGWLLAGELYLLLQKGPLLREDFTASLHPDKAVIYCRGAYIYTVSRQKEDRENDLSKKADACINSFIALTAKTNT